ncbi:MAG: carbohydrate-binding family 9-like protein [Verrucomicrobiota bacterium]|nr:carbohydrate-binding family 9-like protein [Verrucomicrobiota bacterium]
MKREKPGRPLIECRELPPFAEHSLGTVRRAFERAVPCPLGQAWLKKTEVGFAPAVVRTGWRDQSLLVFAELRDADIFTRAKAHGERLWELSDAFEIFLRPAGRRGYVEFQVAPNNLRLQLRFADARAVARARKTGSLEDARMGGDAFRSRTWLRPKAGRWFVFAEIPAASVCGRPEPLPGSEWFFSFSRYDYTRGCEEPVISSTSPHARPDFHRRHEWGVIRFQN